VTALRSAKSFSFFKSQDFSVQKIARTVLVICVVLAVIRWCHCSSSCRRHGRVGISCWDNCRRRHGRFRMICCVRCLTLTIKRATNSTGYVQVDANSFCTIEEETIPDWLISVGPGFAQGTRAPLANVSTVPPTCYRFNYLQNLASLYALSISAAMAGALRRVVHWAVGDIGRASQHQAMGDVVGEGFPVEGARASIQETELPNCKGAAGSCVVRIGLAEIDTLFLCFKRDRCNNHRCVFTAFGAGHFMARLDSNRRGKLGQED